MNSELPKKKVNRTFLHVFLTNTSLVCKFTCGSQLNCVLERNRTHSTEMYHTTNLVFKYANRVS